MDATAATSEYMAFISYRHSDNRENDRQWASWLHQQLEVYDVPAELIGTVNSRGEIIPERIYPVFRDEVSLPADADLSSAIVDALDASRFLVVLCSPRAVQSKYLSDEITHFKASGKADRVIAALLLGEPNASVDPAKVEDPEDARTLECFPPPLRYDVTVEGQLEVNKPTEPLAADFRLPDGNKGLTNPSVYRQQLLQAGHKTADAEQLANAYEEKLSTAKLKIIAGILGVRLDTLIARDKLYQLKNERARTRRAWQVGLSLAALSCVAAIGAVFSWFQYKQAEQERDIAQRSVAKYFATEATRLDSRQQGSLAVLLSLEAYRLDRTTQTDEALRGALNRHLWEPLAGHQGRVTEIAISGDARWLVSTGVDKTVRVWDLESPRRTNSIVLADAGHTSHIAVGGERLAVATDGKVQLWHLSDMQAKPLDLPAPLKSVTSLTISAAGNLLAAADDGGVVRVWSVDAEKTTATDMNGVGGEVFALALSPNGEWLAAGGPQKEISLWHTEALEHEPRQLASGQLEVYDIAFSGDSRRLATGGFDPLSFNLLSIWQLSDLGAPPKQFSMPPAMSGFGNTIASIALATEGDKILSGGTDGVFRLITTDDATSNSEFVDLGSRIHAVAEYERKWLAAAVHSGTIWIYDQGGSGREPVLANDDSGFVTAVAFDNSGNRFLSGNSDGSVRVHDANRPASAAELLTKSGGAVFSLATSPDNRWLAIGDDEGNVLLSDLFQPEREAMPIVEAFGTVNQLLFDRHSRRLAVAGSAGLRLFDTDNITGQPTDLNAGGDRIIALHFGDGDILHAATATNTILSWQPPYAGGPASRTDVGGTESQAAAFSPDGQWLALSNANNRLELLPMKRLTTAPIELTIAFDRQTFSAFGYPVRFSPDSRWLAFVGGDYNVWVWRVGEWSVPPFALRMHAVNAVSSIAFSHDARRLSSGGMDGMSRLWSLPPALVDRACHRTGRNMSLREWRRYWGDRDYARTCLNWPLPEDLVEEAATDYARDGNAAAALHRLRSAWGDVDDDSDSIDTMLRQALANALIRVSVHQIDRSGAAESAVEDSLRHLEAVFELIPELDPSTQDISAGGWNKLCWHGSLARQAEDVIFACDLAVNKAPPTRADYYRDSRGVARVLVGDFAGAIEDLEAFIAWAEGDSIDQAAIDKRRRWVTQLRLGENPLDEETLQRLRQENL